MSAPSPMKNSLAILAAVLTVAMSAQLHAQTLNWGSDAFSDLVDSNGEVLGSNYVFALGTFGDFVPDAWNVGDWSTYWRSIDTADYNELNGVFTGTFTLQEIADYQSLFAGLQAYIWVYNSTTPGTETEWFLAGGTVESPWIFPEVSTCCPGPVTEWSITQLGSDAPVWGNQSGVPGGGVYPDNGTYDLQTHIVPEPGVSLMALVGVMYFLLRRRRADVVHA